MVSYGYQEVKHLTNLTDATILRLSEPEPEQTGEEARVTYCVYGAQRKSVIDATAIPVPDVIQITAGLLTTAGLVLTDAPLLAQLVVPMLGSYINTDAFCAVVPQDAPPLWTLTLLLNPVAGPLAAQAWVNYFLWRALCECKSSPGGTGCLTVHYGDNVRDWGGYAYDYGTHGVAGTYYDTTITVPGPSVSHYDHFEGPIGWMWNKPTSELGTEPAGSHNFRLLGQVSVMSYPTLTYGTTLRASETDTVYGADQSTFVIEICESAGGSTGTPPPSVTAPTDPADVTPYPDAACTSFADVCAKLNEIEQLVKLGFNDRLNTSTNSSGTFDMTDDGQHFLLADAVLFHTTPIPPGISRQGSDPAYYTVFRNDAPIGWYAFGNGSGWYDRQYLTWEDQWSGAVPKDATMLTWHLQSGLTVTASTFVRSGS